MRKNRQYTDLVRLSILENYLSSDLTKYSFERQNSLNNGTISKWLRIFAIPDKSSSAPIVMNPTSLEEKNERLQSEIRQLQIELKKTKASLHQAQMGEAAYKLMVELAEKQFNITIRKKSAAK